MHGVRITVLCDECVRIEYAPSGRFCDHPSLFAIHAPSGDLSREAVLGSGPRHCETISADAGTPPLVVETKRLKLCYTPDGRPPHAGNMHALVVHPSPPQGVPVRDGRVLWTPGAKNLHNLGGTLSTLDGLRGPHPLGEGLLARDGWQVVDDSSRHLLVDGWAATRESLGLSRNTDWYLFAYGDDYPAALRAMTFIAGRIPMPRKYALGAWYSRYWPYTSDEFRGIVDEFELHGFPLDVLVLDMDWHREGWTGWSWNRALIPDPEDLLAWLHSRGLAVTLNLHPSDGVAPHEDRYAELMRALGREPNGSTVPFDAGDRNYMHALFDQIHRPLESPPSSHPPSAIRHSPTGVDFWWLDWQQDKYVRSISGLTNLRWLNHLYHQHTSRAPTGEDPGLRGQSFSRWAGDEAGSGPGSGATRGDPASGGWGDHRHPVHFSGDAHTGWDMLAFQVPFTATAGNIGCFYWSHDIGGHFGPRLEETTARWVQFGALSAALRLHSARTASLDRRPWTYEARFRESMRRAFELRARLMPYIYTCARACEKESLPLLRPMYLHHPRAERAYRAPGQYLLGPDLLAAPIVSPGIGDRCVGTRYVWFPTCDSSHPTPDTRYCTSWYDLSTGERHDSNSEAIVSADIDHTPLFLRAGVLLPTQPPGPRMTRDPVTTLILRCFAGADGQTSETVLYEDDGLSRAHELGQSAATALRAHWERKQDAGRTVVALDATIAPTHGRYTGQPPQRAVELHIGALARVLEATVDGLPAQFSHTPDLAGGAAVIGSPAGDIRRGVRFRVIYEPADNRLLGHRVRLANLSAAMAREVGMATLRDVVLRECAAGPDPVVSEREAEHAANLLEIGAGIGAVVEEHSVRFVDSLGWIDGTDIDAQVIDRLGRTETVLASRQLTLEPSAGHARAASLALRAVSLEPPPVGQRATRLARFRFKVHGVPLTVSTVAQTRMTALSEFLVLGPFPWDWHNSIADVEFDPEGKPVDPARKYAGRDNQEVSWRPSSRGPSWDVDIAASLGASGGLAYGASLLNSPILQKAKLHFDCSDKLEAWLNGVKIITLDDYSTHGSPRNWAQATLLAGPNELLVKATHGGGGWGLVAYVEADHAITHAHPA